MCCCFFAFSFACFFTLFSRVLLFAFSFAIFVLFGLSFVLLFFFCLWDMLFLLLLFVVVVLILLCFWKKNLRNGLSGFLERIGLDPFN